MPTSRTSEEIDRDFTVAWRRVIRRNDDSNYYRVHVSAGENRGTRFHAGALKFRLHEYIKWVLTMDAGGAERLEDLDYRCRIDKGETDAD